jgi:hypothetical protein
MIRHLAWSMILAILLGIGATRSLAQGGPGIVIAVSEQGMATVRVGEKEQTVPHWYRPSKMEDNPLAWMILVNGFAVDVRQMPRAIQEVAYQKGLIPYLPGER